MSNETRRLRPGFSAAILKYRGIRVVNSSKQQNSCFVAFRLKTTSNLSDIEGKMFQFPFHTIAAVSTRNRIVEAWKGFSSGGLK